MTELVAFLRARLEDDQRIAEAAGGGGGRDGAGIWTRSRGGFDNSGEWDPDGVGAFATVEGDINIYAEGGHDGEQAEHIARWDPARVLADVAAKRTVVAECVAAIEAGEIQPGTTWNDMAAGSELAVDVLRLLVQPYVNHPGFDHSWLVPATEESVP